jgi:hypothetical protein
MFGSYRIVPLNKNRRAEPCGNETKIRMHSAFHVFGSDEERRDFDWTYVGLGSAQPHDAINKQPREKAA